MITIYPDEFNLRDEGSYRQMIAIRGETGPAGPQGERGYGIGSADFVPQVSLSEVQPTVVNGTVWIKLLSTDIGYALGNVMCGTDYTLPSTRWDGTALQQGDVYIIMGKANSHPVTWGSVTFCPFKCYLRISNNTWDYRQAEVYVDNAWWPLNAEWIIENGNILGASSIPTTGTAKYSVSKSGDYLVLIGDNSITTVYYIACTFGTETLSACTYYMVGEIQAGTYSAKYGALQSSQTGASTSTHSFATSTSIPSNVTQTDPSINASAYSPGRTFAIETGVRSEYTMPVVRIKHLYRVFNS